MVFEKASIQYHLHLIDITFNFAYGAFAQLEHEGGVGYDQDYFLANETQPTASDYSPDSQVVKV